ncbi:MAG: hypothetical protein ABIH78_03520 [Candidatus Peregrinibacteria bacterium]
MKRNKHFRPPAAAFAAALLAGLALLATPALASAPELTDEQAAIYATCSEGLPQATNLVACIKKTPNQEDRKALLTFLREGRSLPMFLNTDDSDLGFEVAAAVERRLIGALTPGQVAQRWATMTNLARHNLNWRFRADLVEALGDPRKGAANRLGIEYFADMSEEELRDWLEAPASNLDNLRTFLRRPPVDASNILMYDSGARKRPPPAVAKKPRRPRATTCAEEHCRPPCPSLLPPKGKKDEQPPQAPTPAPETRHGGYIMVP